MTTPTGWYPEPLPKPGEPPALRYWDGQNWTDHVAPAVAPTASSARLATTPDGEPLAGWWWRVLAYLIDSLLVGVVSTIATLPAQIALQRDLATLEKEFTRSIEANPEQPPFGQFLGDMLGLYQDRALWLFLPGFLISLAYVAPMLRWKGATVGKLAVGLRVRRRDDPGQLPWSTILIRWAVQFALVNTLVFAAFASGSWAVAGVLAITWSLFALLDPLWATWDSKKQTIHDKAAKTNVVTRR